MPNSRPDPSLGPKVSDEAIDTFRRDGVVCLRQVFGPQWLDLLRCGIAENLERPSPKQEIRRAAADNSGPRYIEDFWVWSDFPPFERFVRQSPAAGLAAQLLDARRINLVMDNWFLREAGSTARPPWHHDISYFDFEGSMCVLWLPLDPTSKEDSIAFVRGSHLWNRLFMRTLFADHSAAAEPGVINGQRYEAPPDIDAAPGDYDLVSFDCAPGDCVFFDMRCLHGALGASTPKSTVRRYTLRMTKEDGHIRYRGDWAKQERAIMEAAGHREGDALISDFFPTLWENAQAS
ncbi:phytanoyl-CoA dioxygenase family protein [Pelagibius litoralis]|uniref:Phytanoyl-CoA dioxygenase family protein n=1 Tax=Pelagibius litoralis TaxID=374515 RepID=A0A967EVE2_9PROT|nr:phytanoyl-CoA dioxygenase family protein [Pelagibius litoralis]NIA68372.1 phytanoyl-CoA dioxygenase family protein [Pelagibius litoralis]